MFLSRACISDATVDPCTEFTQEPRRQTRTENALGEKGNQYFFGNEGAYLRGQRAWIGTQYSKGCGQRVEPLDAVPAFADK